MKRFWAATALLAVIFLSTIAHSLYLTHLTAQLTQTIESATHCARQEDWSQTQKLVQQAQDLWQGHDLYLHVTLRHDTVDGVFCSFRDLDLLCHQADRQGYELVSTRLLASLELLCSAERFSFENIL